MPVYIVLVFHTQAFFFFLQIHIHPSRQKHSPHKLILPDHLPADAHVQRKTMQLFAVLCINTSHYVSFVKYGTDPRSWIFFDSMADRYGRSHTHLHLITCFFQCRPTVPQHSFFNQTLDLDNPLQCPFYL